MKNYAPIALFISVGIIVLLSIFALAFIGVPTMYAPEEIREATEEVEGEILEEEGETAEELVFKKGEEDMVMETLTYGDDELQDMDIFYRPDQENAPVVFVVHGGAEDVGDKRKVHDEVRNYEEAGYTVITPNHRYGTHPALGRQYGSYDLACAVVTLKENAERYQINPDKIIVQGISHGGYISGFFIYDQEWDWLNECDIQGDFSVNGFIGHATNYGNFVADWSRVRLSRNKVNIEGLKDVYSDERGPRDGAINYLDPEDAPALLLHGDEDEVFNEQRAIDFKNRLRAKGVEAFVQITEGEDHQLIIRENETVIRRVKQFTEEIFNL